MVVAVGGTVVVMVMLMLLLGMMITMDCVAGARCVRWNDRNDGNVLDGESSRRLARKACLSHSAGHYRR